jgi:hypothetical protein
MSAMQIACNHSWVALPYDKSGETVKVLAGKGYQNRVYDLYVTLLQARSDYFREK